MPQSDLPDAAPQIVSVTKIWDRAPHNAFTDLLRFDEKWWCTFREAENHGASYGTLHIIVSDDGEHWTSAAELSEPGVDLRDPKLSIMPDGRLMLLTCGCLYANGVFTTRCPRVSFSDDGRNWTPPQRFLAEDHWLWRVTWHGGVGYGVSKLGEGRNPRRGFLYRTADGLDWEWITEFILPDDIWTVSETTLRIMPDEEMIGLIRLNWIGTSRPPYVDWSFTKLERGLGGPNFIRTPDGRLWATTRYRDDGGRPRTVLARMTRDNVVPVLTLPSGGDTSYAGMVWREDLLWISYYSSHEERTSIYLAKVRLGDGSPGQSRPMAGDT